jgi:hypothetical protein
MHSSTALHRFVFLALVPLLLALAGCSGLIAPQEDPQLAQLAAGMEQCLQQQREAGEQLQRQEQQMQQQEQALQALARAVAPPAENTETVKTVEVMAAPEACVAEPALSPAPERPAKLVVGELEEVWLENLQLALPARIDTGAETASLDARNIEVFERDGRRWVRFEIVHPVSGEPVPMERRLKRMVSIIQANSPEAERRPVIKLGITIGHISQTAEFTLSDRSHLDYQVLVGRNILQDVMVVDVSRKNIAPYQLPDVGEPAS